MMSLSIALKGCQENLVDCGPWVFPWGVLCPEHNEWDKTLQGISGVRNLLAGEVVPFQKDVVTVAADIPC